jgi:hypothetical protein
MQGKQSEGTVAPKMALALPHQSLAAGVHPNDALLAIGNKNSV